MALAPPIALLGVALAGLAILGGPGVPAVTPPWLTITLLFLFVLLLGGRQEEPGWRGFALPLLQRRYGALTARLLLGAIWAVWHLPLFVIPGSPQWQLSFLPFAVMALALSVIFASLYNATAGSVLVVMVLHAMVNLVTAWYPATAGAVPQYLLAIVAWFWAGGVILRYGPRDLLHSPGSSRCSRTKVDQAIRARAPWPHRTQPTTLPSRPQPCKARMVRKNSTTGTQLSEPVRLGSGSFTRAGSTIHYWTAGEVAAPAVVFTHGVTVDHGTWAHQLDPLTQACYRVVAWDMRGHGLSEPMGDRLSMELAADDLAALLDEVEVDEAVLVGQSFAGFVVQDFYQRWPNRVRALVLVGSTALGDRIPLHQLLLQRTRPLLLRLWPEGHLRRVTPSFLSRRPMVQRYIARAMEPLSKADLVTVTQAALEGLLRQRPMGPLEVPLLLVRGDEEMPPIARMMDAWALRDAAVRLEVVDGAGHLVNQEAATDINGILLRFLRDDVAA